MTKDQNPIACLRDLKPGEEVLVLQCHSGLHWNCPQYCGCQENHKERHENKIQLLKNSTAFHHYPKHQSTSSQDHPNKEDHSVIRPPTPWPVCQTPSMESSLPSKPEHQPVTAWPQYQLPVSQSSPHKLGFHYSFSQNKSDIPKISTKYICALNVFPLKVVLGRSVVTLVKYHPARFHCRKMDAKAC